MKRLVLVRHGESEWNAQRRIQGQAGGGLSEIGHEQARLTAAALGSELEPASAGMTGGIEPAARLIASDLQRTVETATPIAAALGVDLETDPQLRERDFGRWSGSLRADVQSDDAEVWRRWVEGEDVVGELGGESATTFGERVVAVLERYIDGTPEDTTTILVTHGGPIWHGTHALLDLAHGTLGGVANTSITELGLHGTHGRWLERWNGCGHLPAHLRTTFRPSETRAASLIQDRAEA